MTDHAQNVSYDMGFGENFSWDIPLLGGYPHRFLTVNKNWRLGNRKLLGVRLREPLQPLIARTGTKVVWTQGWQTLAYWQAVWQARRAGAQVWLRGESNDLSGLGGWLRRSAKAVALAALFRRVNHFLCIGSANRRLYRKYGVPDLRLHQAPYCVDNARFAAEAKKFRAMRKKIRLKWNIPETAFCVLFCGKFMRKKRPLDVVAAASQRNGALVIRLGLQQCRVGFLQVGLGRNDVGSCIIEVGRCLQQRAAEQGRVDQGDDVAFVHA